MYMLGTYNESADLGFMYMAEQTSPEENSVSNLSFTDKAGVTFCQFNTVLHTFRTMNRNKRQYLAENVQERLNDERIQCELRDNAWYGEQDHPMQLTTDAKLTPERVRNIYLPNRSHKIMNPLIKGDILTIKSSLNRVNFVKLEENKFFTICNHRVLSRHLAVDLLQHLK